MSKRCAALSRLTRASSTVTCCLSDAVHCPSCLNQLLNRVSWRQSRLAAGLREPSNLPPFAVIALLAQLCLLPFPALARAGRPAGAVPA